MEFENPANNYVEEVDGAWFYTLIFGCFYLGYKGAWVAAILSFFAAFMTAGIAWFIIPIFADDILRKSYLRRGWRDVTKADTDQYAPKPVKRSADHEKRLAESKKKMGW